MAESIAATEAVSVEQARGIIDTFTVVRNLGIIAADLQTQARAVESQAFDVAPDALEMPAGTVLIVSPTDHDEDPMYTEAYMEVDRENWPIFPGTSIEWSFVRPGDQEYEGNIVKTSRDVPAFHGKTLKYDTDTRKIWVYNEAGDFRVLYREGIELRLANADLDND